MTIRQKHQWMRSLLGTIVLSALPLVTNVYAEEPVVQNPTYQVSLKPQSKLGLTGDSTLHPYASTATVINLLATFQKPNAEPPSFVEKLSESDVLTFQVTIPVESLKSGEKGLDKNLYKALKADKFPSIEFRLTDKHLLANSPAAGVNQLASNGVLSIAGKENVIQIDSQFELLPEGIRIFGTKHLLMTDYGVKPPTILGVIKVKNDVIIHFDLVLGLQDDQK